jgi:hypothetical protein
MDPIGARELVEQIDPESNRREFGDGELERFVPRGVFP